MSTIAWALFVLGAFWLGEQPSNQTAERQSAVIILFLMGFIGMIICTSLEFFHR